MRDELKILSCVVISAIGDLRRFLGPLVARNEKKPSRSARLAAGISRALTPRIFVPSIRHSNLQDRLYIANRYAAEEPRRPDACLEWVFCVLSSVWCVHTGFGHYVAVGHVVELITDKGATNKY